MYYTEGIKRGSKYHAGRSSFDYNIASRPCYNHATSGTRDDLMKMKAQHLYLILKFYLFDLPRVLGESRHSSGYKEALHPGL